MIVNTETHRYFQNISAENIPSGLKFPIDMLTKVAPKQVWGPTGLMSGRGEVLDMAGGAGKNTEELKRRGFEPVLIDINEDAVSKLDARGFFAYVSNILLFADNWGGAEFAYLEHFPYVLLNAVFSSVPFREVLKVADAYTRPGGEIVAAEFIAADRGYKELKHVPDWGRKKWENRYRQNYLAFQDIGIPYRTFLVVKPGEHKARLDWCQDPGVLLEIWERRNEPIGSHPYAGICERFASHLDPQAFVQYAQHDLGYKILENRVGIVSSRDPRGGGSPVMYTALKKPKEEYRFHPWKHGIKIKDPQFWEKWKANKRKHVFPYEITKYYQLLIKNMKKRDLNTDVFQSMLKRFQEGDRKYRQAMARKGNN